MDFTPSVGAILTSLKGVKLKSAMSLPVMGETFEEYIYIYIYIYMSCLRTDFRI
jgi:hypothetical protein